MEEYFSSDDLRDNVGPIARALLGPPNRKYSKGTEMRWNERGSLCVFVGGPKKGTWSDYQNDQGGGVLDLIERETGLHGDDRYDWLRKNGFRGSGTNGFRGGAVNGSKPGSVPKKTTRIHGDRHPTLGKPVETYPYGNGLYETARFDPKEFRPRQPDGAGSWYWDLDGLDDKLVVFRKTEIDEAIAAGHQVDFFEGEKDALCGVEVGLNATCIQGGTSGWRPIYVETFRDADVVLHPDNDDPGRRFMDKIATALTGVVKRVRIHRVWEHWKECPQKGDFHDWVHKGGGTREQLNAVVAALDEPPPPDDRAPAFSEEAIALDFASKHGSDLKYVSKWGQWFIWDGSCWREDEKRKVYKIARGMCREVALTVNKPGEGKKIASARTRAAVVSLAGEDYRIAASTDQWDSNPWLLNTPRGVVDLRTGEMREHRPDDYITKQTAVSPGGDCPKWLAFLAKVTKGDAELQSFLQRWCGYALTGSTREHAMGFGYGVGANGKSVFTGTIAGILADYATTAPIETFTVTSSEQHPTELARLRGARLVVATETEEGRRWAESKIKMLTGGDKTAARFMRQDFFEFTPAFKLWIVGNFKPGLRAVNEAIRRRFLLVPFNVVIPPEERDLNLTEKLKAEWPGILRWMVDGAVAWQEKGLAAPKAVTDATEDYLASEDAISLWLNECTVPDPEGWVLDADLFKSWTEWANAAGEYVGTRRRFLQNLETKKGLFRERKDYGRGFRGLRLDWGGREAADATTA
jgi:putative DNA primase/helicase